MVVGDGLADLVLQVDDVVDGAVTILEACLRIGELVVFFEMVGLSVCNEACVLSFGFGIGRTTACLKTPECYRSLYSCPSVSS